MTGARQWIDPAIGDFDHRQRLPLMNGVSQQLVSGVPIPACFSRIGSRKERNVLCPCALLEAGAYLLSFRKPSLTGASERENAFQKYVAGNYRESRFECGGRFVNA